MSLIGYNPVLSASALALPLLIGSVVGEATVATETLSIELRDYDGVKEDEAMSMMGETSTGTSTENGTKTTDADGEVTSTEAMEMTTAMDSSTTETPMSADTVSSAQALWAQCGGAGYTGQTSCDFGMSCASVNDNWAHCVTESTLASSQVTMSSRASAKVSSSAESEKKGLSQSTIYSYETNTVQYTITSTDSAGHTFKTTINSESTKAIAKGFTEVTVSFDNSGNPNAFFSSNNQHWKGKLLVSGVVALSALLM